MFALTQRVFAERLAEIQVARGISNVELAAGDWRPQSISRWRKPDYAHGPPAPKDLRRLEQKLRLPAGAFNLDAKAWQVVVNRVNLPAGESKPGPRYPRVAEVRAASWERFAILERRGERPTPSEASEWMDRLFRAFYEDQDDAERTGD